MFYFIFGSYNPTKPSSIRALAYISAMSDMGTYATFLFMLPDKNHSKIEKAYGTVRIEYPWEKFYINSKVLKYISYYFYIKQFIRGLHLGDSVYLYDLNDVPKYLFRKKGIRIFYEKTEHPLISNYGSLLRRPSLESHISDCQKYSGVFVISSALKDYYISKGIPSDKITVVNIIVDPKRFADKVKNPKERYIAYCGNSENKKDGVDQLIKSFSIIAPSYPDLKLYIIGPRPLQDNPDSNYWLVQRLNLQDRVIFTGLIAPFDIPELLLNAEVLALDRPDNLQAKYGFPTKLGEYLMSGNPVVLTDVGDMHNYLKDKENVLFAKPDDINDFSEKIRWVLDHPFESSKIGENGKVVALEQFNNVREVSKIIKAMCNENTIC